MLRGLARIFGICIVVVSTPASARAESAAEALQGFGIIGTWSSDCTKNISEARGGRVVFAAPLAGPATATTQDHGEVLTTIVYEIRSARTDRDKIRMALHPVTVTKSNGKTPTRHDYDNLNLVFQRVGERIEVIRVQFEGLPEVERANFFEKCTS